MQDSQAAAFGPASAVGGDFDPAAQGGPGDISSNSPGAPCATSADFPSRPGDTPDRRRSSADDNRSGVGSGMRVGYKPVVEDDIGSAEKFAGSNGNGDSSLGGSRGERKGFILPGNALRLESTPPGAYQALELTAYNYRILCRLFPWYCSCFSMPPATCHWHFPSALDRNIRAPRGRQRTPWAGALCCDGRKKRVHRPFASRSLVFRTRRVMIQISST